MPCLKHLEFGATVNQTMDAPESSLNSLPPAGWVVPDRADINCGGPSLSVGADFVPDLEESSAYFGREAEELLLRGDLEVDSFRTLRWKILDHASPTASQQLLVLGVDVGSGNVGLPSFSFELAQSLRRQEILERLQEELVPVLGPRLEGL
jgi:hypothetical protein